MLKSAVVIKENPGFHYRFKRMLTVFFWTIVVSLDVQTKACTLDWVFEREFVREMDLFRLPFSWLLLVALQLDYSGTIPLIFMSFQLRQHKFLSLVDETDG